MQRHDERAVGRRSGIGRTPQREATATEVAHDEFSAFLLAIRREHGAGIEAAAMHEWHRRALADCHSVPAASKRKRLPKADHTGAADGDVALLVGHCGFFSKGLAAKRLIPERHAFAAWVGAAFESVGRDGDDGEAAGEGEALDLMAELG